MSDYTESIEEYLYSFDIYEDTPDKLVSLFRSFDKAFDTFIVERGYTDDINSIEQKIEFIKRKFVNAGVPIPRNLKKWYTEGKQIERLTPIQICFAFELSVDEANDFFKRIYLHRGFDCHNPKELILYFALSHGLKYKEAEAAFSIIEEIEASQVPESNVIYTKNIQDEIVELQSLDEVVDYINTNRYKFGYNNAKAYESIQHLWKESSEIIEAENKLGMYESFYDDRVSENEEEEKDKAYSIWNKYLQILGLLGNRTKEYNNERSLKAVLIDNKYIHPSAADCFPNREAINKILNRKMKSDETVRKLLVLLGFFTHWGSLAIEKKDYHVEAKDRGYDRFVYFVDNLLIDAGYPTLYIGNPFDWIVIYASLQDDPLAALRDYMRESYDFKQELLNAETHF